MTEYSCQLCSRLMANAMSSEPQCACFHCSLPVPEGVSLSVRIDGEARPMCCHGCKAVAEAIVNSGHEHFYRVRTKPSATGTEQVPEFLRETRVYDLEPVQSQLVHRVSGTLREASLMLEGITCAACIWLNEQHISGLPGRGTGSD